MESVDSQAIGDEAKLPRCKELRAEIGWKIQLGLTKLLSIALFSMMIVPGCTQPVQTRFPVAGEVTIGDSKMASGLITFVPLPGTAGLKASTPILDGRYELPADIGLAPGRYRVEIYHLSDSLKAMAEGKPISHTREKSPEIAARFNTKSELTCEIASEPSNTANFAVNYERSSPTRSMR